MNQTLFCGVDIGSATAKAVIIDSSNTIKGSAVAKTGIDMKKISLDVFEQAMEGLNKEDVKYTISTGYGRRIVPYATKNITEITCTARGAYEIFPVASTVVDIGGQDNKVISVGKDGTIQQFQLNRKCAAGTGAFLEEIAWKLDIELSSMNEFGKKGSLHKVLNSYCSVFAATEILEQIRQCETLENMILGAYHSITKRIFDMGYISSPIIVSGGAIQYNPIIVDILREKGYEVKIPPKPQILPAYGASLLASDLFNKKPTSTQSDLILNTS